MKFQWMAGDSLIVDNLALTHMASADTILPPNEIGLRVLHVTCVEGTHKPMLTTKCTKDRLHKDDDM